MTGITTKGNSRLLLGQFMKTKLCLRILGALILSYCAATARPADPPGWGLTLTESEWAGPNIVRIPFTLTGAVITVRARVDTIEGNFFFDTGASGLLLNYRYFGNNTGPAQTGGGGVTGKVEVRGNTRVDTFRFDNLLATGIPAELIDFTHIENMKKIDLVGLIGYSVFKDYEILFDYEASLIVLIRLNADGGQAEALPRWEYKPAGGADIRSAGHIAVVWLKFEGGKDKKFGLDSGAEQNLMSNTTGKKFLQANFEIRKRVKLRGTGNQSLEVLSGTLRNATIDTVHLKPMATLLTNMSEINAAWQTDLDGVLGYEFLSQRPVSVNHRKRRLTFYVKERP